MAHIKSLFYTTKNNPDLRPTVDGMLKLNGNARYDINIMGIGREGTAVVNAPFEMGRMKIVDGETYIDYSSYGRDGRGYRTIQAMVPVRVSRL